jgi:glycine/D-amino acid oxidase-like deaminating enzyme
MPKRVIVIGSGIIGASTAWHLAKAGADVTVLEAGEPGGIATRASWAWINASWGNPEPYFRLRMRSIDEWHRLEKDVPALRPNWCGGLIWDLPAAELDAYAEQRKAWGHPIRRVSREEILGMEPTSGRCRTTPSTSRAKVWWSRWPPPRPCSRPRRRWARRCSPKPPSSGSRARPVSPAS